MQLPRARSGWLPGRPHFTRPSGACRQCSSRCRVRRGPNDGSRGLFPSQSTHPRTTRPARTPRAMAIVGRGSGAGVARTSGVAVHLYLRPVATRFVTSEGQLHYRRPRRIHPSDSLNEGAPSCVDVSSSSVSVWSARSASWVPVPPPLQQADTTTRPRLRATAVVCGGRATDPQPGSATVRSRSNHDRRDPGCGRGPSEFRGVRLRWDGLGNCQVGTRGSSGPPPGVTQGDKA